MLLIGIQYKNVLKIIHITINAFFYFNQEVTSLFGGNSEEQNYDASKPQF